MVQVQFVISRTRIKKDRPPASPTKSQMPARQVKKSRVEKTDPKERTSIDSSVFSEFQKNLSLSAEKTSDRESDEKDVVVSISSKGKSRTGPAERKQTTVPASLRTKQSSPIKVPAGASQAKQAVPDDISVEPIGPIFDDISETPEILSNKVDPVKRPPTKLEKLRSVEPPATEKTQSPEPERNTPLRSNEVLTQDDFKPDEESLKNEADIALSLAENYFNKKDYEKSLSAIKQFLENEDLEKANPDMVIKMSRLKGDCELELKQFEQASITLQDYFKNKINNQHPLFLDQLEQTVSKFVDADQQQYAVHFLFTALNEFRQLHEFHKMDELYAEIESAYHQKQDLPRLTQTYQNHLAIKKTIKDFKGQLDILDQLGKLLYDQGDDEGSRKCYEQRLAIETKMEKS